MVNSVLTQPNVDVPLAGVGGVNPVYTKYDEAKGEIKVTFPNITQKSLFDLLKSSIGPLFSAQVIINEIMNFESADKEYAGPGSNMKASGYPQGFKNQAVGHHPNTNNPCVSNIHGQIVRMYQIEIHDVRGLSYCPEQLKLTPYFYYFDVQNDKEGDCEAC
jgi:hypothetical protein